MTKPSKKQKKELAALAAMRDDQIDLSDAAEVRDWSRAVVGKFYGPIKKSLTIRLEPICSHGSSPKGAATRRASTNSFAQPWMANPAAVEHERNAPRRRRYFGYHGIGNFPAACLN